MNRIENSGKHLPGVLRVNNNWRSASAVNGAPKAFILPLTAGADRQRIENGARRGSLRGNKHTVSRRKAPRPQARTAEEAHPRKGGRTAAHRAIASSLGARNRSTAESSAGRNKRAEDTDARRTRTVTRRPSTAERPPDRPADVGTAAHGGLRGRFPRTRGLSFGNGAAMKMGAPRGSAL